MKIISPWKDYYDFISHQYGGGDPKVVYDRRRLQKSATLNIRDIPHVYLSARDSSAVDANYISLCGKVFIIYRYLPTLQWKAHYPGFDENVDKVFGLNSKYFINRNAKYFKTRWQERPIIQECLKVSQELLAPVFHFKADIRNPGQFKTLDIVPKLGDLGFPGFLDAFQAYQEIAYFVGNIMKESPDITPPASVSNDNRIVQHGFDLKKSFRHR